METRDEPTDDHSAFEISLKAGKMCLNRFCIDEDAAFELSGVCYMHQYRYLREWCHNMKEDIYPNFRKVFDDKTEDLETHIVYAGSYGYWHSEIEELKSLILEAMKKYKTKSVLVTVITLGRWFLITKEKMESYCNGKMSLKESVNDDLEAFFEDIRLGLQQLWRYQHLHKYTYFLPKLTEEEMRLVERFDVNYMNTFHNDWDADVEEAEMKSSQSDSKFVLGICSRQTFRIEN